MTYIDREGNEHEAPGLHSIMVEEPATVGGAYILRYIGATDIMSFSIVVTPEQILALAERVKRDRLEAEIAPLRELTGRELAAKYWEHEISSEAFSAAVDDLARRTGREGDE